MPLRGRLPADRGVLGLDRQDRRIATIPRRGRPGVITDHASHLALGESEKDEHCPIEPQDILVVQPANALAGLRFRNGGDLVHHYALPEPVAARSVRGECRTAAHRCCQW